VGAGGGLLALAAGEALRRSSGTVDATLHRMLDNSNVFGFGFLAHAPGRMAVALLVALLIAHQSERAHRRENAPDDARAHHRETGHPGETASCGETAPHHDRTSR
jgi:hypothetical protein